MDIQQIGSILHGLGVDTQNLCEDSRLTEDLGIDSQEMVELCGEILLLTGVDIPDRKLFRSASVRDLLDFVRAGHGSVSTVEAVPVTTCDFSAPADFPRADDLVLRVIEAVQAVNDGMAPPALPLRLLAPEERVTLMREIDGRLGLQLGAEALAAQTAQEFLDCVRVQNLFEGMQGAFQHGCEFSMEIACSRDRAYAALHDMRAWPAVLPHVKSIEVIYDDGCFQEFLMGVESERGMLHVRSVRRCEEGVGIRFFQPKPPAFLKHHAGGWRFRELGPERCLVTALHYFSVVEEADENEANEVQRSNDARALLREHAALALTHWKAHLEGSTP